MKISRREAIKLSLLASGIPLIPWTNQRSALAAEDCCSEMDVDSSAWREFEENLSIPPLLEPVCSKDVGINGMPTDYYEIEMKCCQKMIGGESVEIWGYNGITPGSLIKQQIDDPNKELRYSVVRFINKLGNDAEGDPIDTVIHLHGMGSAPEYDGYAEDSIAPEHYKDYIYPNDRAATIWYHDHQLDKTCRNVRKGLLGMYIVEDQFERDLPLPKGEYDVPLILQLNPDEDDFDLKILVNGSLKPRFEVERRKYRFRVLNATAQDILNLSIGQPDNPARNQTLTIIGTDGGLRQNPVDVNEFEIAPAERYEFVVDFKKIAERGVNQIYLNIDAEFLPRPREAILRFDIKENNVSDPSSVPSFIRSVQRFKDCPEVSMATLLNDAGECKDDPSKCATLFRFAQNETEECEDEEYCIRFGEGVFEINGKTWPEQVACPTSGECVVWTLCNNVAEPHPVHVHLIDMQLIKRFRKEGDSYVEVPLEEKPYEANCWKDVFVIKEGEIAQISGKFAKHHSGIYMMHCHNLKHEDCEMMVTFQVGTDGRDPSKIEPAKPVSQMEPLCPTQRGILPSLPQRIDVDAYDSDAIIEYNREVYGPNR